MVRIGHGSATCAIPAQIRYRQGELACEQRGQAMPMHMGLRKTMQQQEQRTLTADEAMDRGILAADRMCCKSLKHHLCSQYSRSRSLYHAHPTGHSTDPSWRYSVCVFHPRPSDCSIFIRNPDRLRPAAHRRGLSGSGLGRKTGQKEHARRLQYSLFPYKKNSKFVPLLRQRALLASGVRRSVACCSLRDRRLCQRPGPLIFHIRSGGRDVPRVAPCSNGGTTWRSFWWSSRTAGSARPRTTV